MLYFADICAGPGGFSEYVLWRKKWKCKGFGLTLKSGPGVNDFKLDEFYSSPSECFEPYYGVGELSVYRKRFSSSSHICHRSLYKSCIDIIAYRKEFEKLPVYISVNLGF